MNTNDYLDIDREMEANEQQYNGVTLTSNSVKTIQEQIDSVLNAIDLGYVNPLEAFAVFKELEKRFNEAKKQIDSLAYEESEKYAKSFELNGYKFTRVEGRKQFDFSNIFEWVEAKNKLKEIEDKYKAVYSNNEKGITALDESTGELLQSPTVTFSKQSLSVKK